ncbi:MAG: hypothetical protein Q8N28_00880 [bacterium]|nr:hypothetical protein [bacterium]
MVGRQSNANYEIIFPDNFLFQEKESIIGNAKMAAKKKAKAKAKKKR